MYEGTCLLSNAHIHSSLNRYQFKNLYKRLSLHPFTVTRLCTKHSTCILFIYDSFNSYRIELTAVLRLIVHTPKTQITATASFIYPYHVRTWLRFSTRKTYKNTHIPISYAHLFPLFFRDSSWIFKKRETKSEVFTSLTQSIFQRFLSLPSNWLYTPLSFSLLR